MRKPIGKEPAKRGRTSVADKMIAEVEEKTKQLRDLVENFELDTFLDGTDIKGTKIDENEDITPEQVAIIGAYATAQQLLDNLKTIKEGKPIKKEKRSKGSITVVGVKDGEHEVITDTGKIPKEVIDELRNFLDEMEKE